MCREGVGAVEHHEVSYARLFRCVINLCLKLHIDEGGQGIILSYVLASS